MNKTAKSHPQIDPKFTNPKAEIEKLAETAFHQHLISGYGDSEYPDEYQIVYQGKPRHLALDQAIDFLRKLIHANDHISLNV